MMVQGLNSDLNNPFFSRNKTSSSVVLLAILCFLSICLTVKLVFGTIFPTEKLFVVSQGLALKKKCYYSVLFQHFIVGEPYLPSGLQGLEGKVFPVVRTLSKHHLNYARTSHYAFRLALH